MHFATITTTYLSPTAFISILKKKHSPLLFENTAYNHSSIQVSSSTTVSTYTSNERFSFADLILFLERKIKMPRLFLLEEPSLKGATNPGELNLD